MDTHDCHSPAVHITRVIGVLEPGGAQLSCLRLARAQAALGVTTTLVAGDATRQGVALAEAHGLVPAVFAMHDEITVSARQWRPDPAFAEWLRPQLRDGDVVHAHMFGAWWAACRAAPAHLPVIASEHNALSWPLGDYTAAAESAAARLTAFYAHGPDARAFAHRIALGPGRVLEGRSTISAQADPRPGLPTPRITFTGRLRADKGPDLLVEALARMADVPPTYLVGDGPMRSVLRHRIGELGLGRRVQVTGWSQQPARYVAGASVHVVPSREEAWSQSAVTALALGVPVVATAVEGLPTTLADGRGILVPPGDPQALADALGAVLAGDVVPDIGAGRRYARRFDAATIAADYFADYQGALLGEAARLV